MHFHHLKHQSTLHYFTSEESPPAYHSTPPNAGVMYSQSLNLFFFFLNEDFFFLNDFRQPAEIKGFYRGTFFFSAGLFFVYFSLSIKSASRRTRDDEGFILYTCRVVLRRRICPFIHTFNTGRDSVDSPSGCKVKHTDVQYICQRTCLPQNFLFLFFFLFSPFLFQLF